MSTNDDEFRKFRLEEKENSRVLIKKSLSEAIQDHHLEPEEIEICIDLLGYEELAKRLPPRTVITKDGEIKKNNVRIGNFGEVVAAEHLCQHYGYSMPVFKLRNALSTLIALPGEDVILFTISEKGKIESICLGEVKTLESYKGIKVEEAHDRLENAYKNDPVTLYFISRTLIKEKNPLGRQIMEILKQIGLKDFPTKNWIFIITGNKPRNPFKRISDMTQIVENLSVASIYLPNLPDFIDEIFDMAVKRP